MISSRDADILEKLKLGNSKAFKELFDLYYVPLTSYSLKYCDSFEMAEDIVQDLFIKFWDDKLYDKLDYSIGPYLFKSVKNNTLLLNKKNSKYRFEAIENQVGTLVDEFNFNNFNLDNEKSKLQDQIDKLPTKSKAVFKAIVLENLKYKEVAKQFNISVNTVKTHYSRALKQLREAVAIIILILLN
ncbi:hypothetical protein PK35_00470 [Tamlana nanhaiensis]|uniref:RNA polymerase sigma-70 factor n=1 Tax=Neotamlana nanhaiensis TaxID=1382798 RepID=A0A0D7W5D0_9FLAO|nr:sigma-70 family RNA polymerase sigma factor [Tamlana nanhaiensis]KJD34331.1 hypothetical protein PK35_00470 [Tamlana nanhaiensis]